MIHLLIIAMLISSAGFVQEKEGQDIIVNMTNFDSDHGKVRVGLFDSEATWLNEGVMGHVVELKDKTEIINIKL